MHYFLESSQFTYCRNVGQVYHSEKKRVILNVPVYVKRNHFCGNLFLQIKNVDEKLFSWMSNNQAYQAIRVEYIDYQISVIDFHTLFNHWWKKIYLLRNQLKIYVINLRPWARVPMAPSLHPGATHMCSWTLWTVTPLQSLTSKEKQG